MADAKPVDVRLQFHKISKAARELALNYAVEADLIEFGEDIPPQVAEAMNCGISAGVNATLQAIRDAYPEPVEDSLGGNTSTSTYEPAGDTTGGGR